MNTNTLTVDYPTLTTMKDAQSFAASVGADYQETGAALTVRAVIATREALRLGWLVDGRKAEDAEIPQVNGGDFAEYFGVTAGLVTRWRSLAAAWDAGVEPGDPRWTALTSWGVRMGSVRKACLTRKAAAINAALKAEGYNARKGIRVAPAKVAGKPRAKVQTDDVKPGDAVPDKVSPKDAQRFAEAAAETLALALAALPVTSGKADVYAAIRTRVLGTIRSEDERRNVSQVKATPATVAKAAKGKAA